MFALLACRVVERHAFVRVKAGVLFGKCRVYAGVLFGMYPHIHLHTHTNTHTQTHTHTHNAHIYTHTLSHTHVCIYMHSGIKMTEKEATKLQAKKEASKPEENEKEVKIDAAKEASKPEAKKEATKPEEEEAETEDAAPRCKYT